MSTPTPPSGHEPGPAPHPGFLGPDGVPQDAPFPSTPPPPSLVKAAPATSVSSPPAAPEPTVIPAPGGPNWGLVLFGLVVMAVAAGVIVNQVNGFRLTDVSSYGPLTLVAIGGACALFGIIGMLARRRS